MQHTQWGKEQMRWEHFAAVYFKEMCIMHEYAYSKKTHTTNSFKWIKQITNYAIIGYCVFHNNVSITETRNVNLYCNPVKFSLWIPDTFWTVFFLTDVLTDDNINCVVCIHLRVHTATTTCYCKIGQPVCSLRGKIHGKKNTCKALSEPLAGAR